MSTTIKTGWLNDKQGNKFAPKTLTSQVQTSDGILIEDKIQTELDTLKIEVLEEAKITIDTSFSSTSTNPVQNKVVNEEFEAVAGAMNVLESAIDDKADKAITLEGYGITDAYTKTEVDTAIDGKSVFVAVYGETTGEELIAADEAGRPIILTRGANVFYLNTCISTMGMFYFSRFYVNNDNHIAMQIACYFDGWFEIEDYAALSLTGGTMTGNLILNADPTDDLGAATKQYVDATQSNATNTLQTYIDEQVENAKKNTWYGTCPTAASTKDKIVTTNTGDFSLTAGNIIYVLFTNYAYSGSTLNVDGTGAIAIKSAGTTNVSTYQWGANEVVGFVYDGTYFRMLDGMTATTTYYGMTKLSSSTSSTATNLAATPSAVKSAYDLANAALPKSGGTLTGALTLNADPTSNMQAATKQYVDNLIGSILNGAS